MIEGDQPPNGRGPGFSEALTLPERASNWRTNRAAGHGAFRGPVAPPRTVHVFLFRAQRPGNILLFAGGGIFFLRFRRWRLWPDIGDRSPRVVPLEGKFRPRGNFSKKHSPVFLGTNSFSGWPGKSTAHKINARGPMPLNRLPGGFSPAKPGGAGGRRMARGRAAAAGCEGRRPELVTGGPQPRPMRLFAGPIGRPAALDGPVDGSFPHPIRAIGGFWPRSVGTDKSGSNNLGPVDRDPGGRPAAVRASRHRAGIFVVEPRLFPPKRKLWCWMAGTARLDELLAEPGPPRIILFRGGFKALATNPQVVVCLRARMKGKEISAGLFQRYQQTSNSGVSLRKLERGGAGPGPARKRFPATVRPWLKGAGTHGRSASPGTGNAAPPSPSQLRRPPGASPTRRAGAGRRWLGPGMNWPEMAGPAGGRRAGHFEGGPLDPLSGMPWAEGGPT